MLLATIFLVFAGAAFGQDAATTPPPSTQDTYAAFFQKVAAANQSLPVPTPGSAKQVQLNGVSVPVKVSIERTQPKDVLGLTEAEMDKLDEIAGDWMERIAKQIGEPNREESYQRRIDELDLQRRQVVVEDLQKLKDSFGEERLKVLDDQVRAGKELPSALDRPGLAR